MTTSGGFQLHFDAGCELQPTSPGAQHSSLDVCGHETLILSRARQKIKDDLAEMDPEVLSPHLQSHLESHADIEHLSAPMSQMEVPLTLKTNNKRQWPLFLYHLLAFCPPRPATSALFQDRNGEDREQGPRSS